jgi:ATP adenylyltransferase
MNLGRTAGAGIDQHCHYHLVPRWDGDTNFMPVVGQTKVISEGLWDSYDRILPLFRDLAPSTEQELSR